MNFLLRDDSAQWKLVSLQTPTNWSHFKVKYASTSGIFFCGFLVFMLISYKKGAVLVLNFWDFQAVQGCSWPSLRNNTCCKHYSA